MSEAKHTYAQVCEVRQLLHNFQTFLGNPIIGYVGAICTSDDQLLQSSQLADGSNLAVAQQAGL